MKTEEIGIQLVEVPEVVNPELPIPDGTVVRVSFGETINIGNFSNIKPEISVEIPTQRRLIKRAIQSAWKLVKEEYDIIVKEVLKEKGL